MKKFFQDFKKFIAKGNIIDMAVGVIVGNAFSAIVKSLTDKIIMPLINYLLALGGSGLDSAFTFLKKARQRLKYEELFMYLLKINYLKSKINITTTNNSPYFFIWRNFYVWNSWIYR